MKKLRLVSHKCAVCVETAPVLELEECSDGLWRCGLCKAAYDYWRKADYYWHNKSGLDKMLDLIE